MPPWRRPRRRQRALAVDEELVPALDQIEGHGMSHDPEPDETDLHDPSSVRLLNEDNRTLLQFQPKPQAGRLADGGVLACAGHLPGVVHAARVIGVLPGLRCWAGAGAGIPIEG